MSESDWDYINDHLGGWDSDGMPNFMSSADFFDEYKDKNLLIFVIVV